MRFKAIAYDESGNKQRPQIEVEAADRFQAARAALREFWTHHRDAVEFEADQEGNPTLEIAVWCPPSAEAGRGIPPGRPFEGTVVLNGGVFGEAGEAPQISEAVSFEVREAD